MLNDMINIRMSDDKTFVGFSTSGVKTSKRAWVQYDADLIKRDLLNHFYTRMGERVMRPTYGSRLWEYIMEPNVESIRSAIVSEVERIVLLDSRLEVSDIQLFNKGNVIIVAMKLYYRPFKTIETFSMEFDRRQAA